MTNPSTTTNAEEKRVAQGPWATIWQRLRKNRVAMVGLLLLILFYTSACLAGFISPYRFDEGDTHVNLYGPMLLGGYHRAPQFDIEKDEAGNETKVARMLLYEYEEGERFEEPEYGAEWRYFDGGVHFTDSQGNFTFRPHVYAIREYAEEDAAGEINYYRVVDKDISLPIEFFVQREPHEVISLCGLFGINGSWHLFSVRAPVGDARFERSGEYRARVFLFGSDKLGRDLFTRILFGGQISLTVGLLGIVLSMSIGLIVGGISGYFGGWVDISLMRLVELLMAIPGLYLILCLRQAIVEWETVDNIPMTSRETYMMIVGVLALAGWAATGRVIRGMVLSIKEHEYVLAAQALGASHLRIIVRHILPNTASFVIVTATLYVPYYILGEVALSYLGLGITEPDASWGLLLKEAQSSQILRYNTWIVAPGFFIFLTVLAYNFLGDGLRDAVDPRAFLGEK